MPFYPSKEELLTYFSLVVIEAEDIELRLPKSLKPSYSDHFENILFVVYYNDKTPMALIKDF